MPFPTAAAVPPGVAGGGANRHRSFPLSASRATTVVVPVSSSWATTTTSPSATAGAASTDPPTSDRQATLPERGLRAGRGPPPGPGGPPRPPPSPPLPPGPSPTALLPPDGGQRSTRETGGARGPILGGPPRA